MFSVEQEKPSFNVVSVVYKMDKLPVATNWVQLVQVNLGFVVSEILVKPHQVFD